MPHTSAGDAKTNQWSEYLREEFRLDRFLSTLTAGVMIGIIVIFIELSFAALIFSGELAVFLSSGIGFLLLGACIIGVILALTSSFPGMTALPQDTPAAVMALSAAAIAASMPATATPDNLFYTVVAAITVSSVLAGIFFLFLGVFHLGSLVRFIPYPVVGGFLAGTGWLLMKGGIGIIADIPITLSSIPQLFEYAVLIKWIPGFVFGIALYIILRRYSHFLILPSMLLAVIGLFYLAIWVFGMSFDDATAQGWLLGPFPEGGGGLWKPLTLSSIQFVDWPTVFNQTGSMVTLLVISVIALLLNAGGVELAIRRDVDLNQELRSAGMANIVLGFCGSPAGYHALSLSVLGFRLGSDSRLIGLISSLMCGIIFFFGASLLSFFPMFVLGGLLLMLGLSFFIEWVYDAWFTLPKIDYFLVLVILGVVGTFGFLQGVFVGFFVAIVLFVLKYSRIDVIKHVLSGVDFHSNVDRSMPLQRLLQERGGQLLIYKLQGFLFFGTAHNLLTKMRSRINDEEQPALQYIVFDFRLVSGLDSSAINSFAKMKQVIESENMMLVFVSLSPQIHRQFSIGGIIQENDPAVRVFPDLDYGMEWCEEKILKSGEPAGDQQRKEFLEESFEDIMKVLDRQENFESILSELAPYLEQLSVEEGQYLIHQGDIPDSMFFIETGQITVQFEHKNGNITRLRTMNLGTVTGELGYYLGQPASASAVVKEPGIIYRLSHKALQKMTESEPRIAANFHKFMAKHISENLSKTNNSLKALLE